MRAKTEIAMLVLRVCLGIGAAVLAGLIVWAIRAGDFFAAGNWLTHDPWGVVTLADLYFGFLLSALVIAFLERNWTALLWILPIPFLGNLWTAIWFVVRFPALLARKRGHRERG